MTGDGHCEVENRTYNANDGTAIEVAVHESCFLNLQARCVMVIRSLLDLRRRRRHMQGSRVNAPARELTGHTSPASIRPVPTAPPRCGAF